MMLSYILLEDRDRHSLLYSSTLKSGSRWIGHLMRTASTLPVDVYGFAPLFVAPWGNWKTVPCPAPRCHALGSNYKYKYSFVGQLTVGGEPYFSLRTSWKLAWHCLLIVRLAADHYVTFSALYYTGERPKTFKVLSCSLAVAFRHSTPQHVHGEFGALSELHLHCRCPYVVVNLEVV